ncbi:MAG: signal peptidase I [Pirellulaceae bacterium]|nr:signal peptidase I [Pirellulaceae bacterium]
MAKNKVNKVNKVAAKKGGTPSDSAKGWREAIESIVIAIVLAFLFRAFEAEAFVIPTGSMAPTLQGRHKDVKCPDCNYRYRAGASIDTEVRDGPVVATTCPMCFFTKELEPGTASDYSHTGDRILVNKFAYEKPFGDPKRWDVIVFKFPGNAKQNYIKRLVGLPDETIKIRHGDIFVQTDEEESFSIARKSPEKLKHMLQLVHDTKYLSPQLRELGWPLRWQPMSSTTGWSTDDGGHSYHCQSKGEEDWIRYRHYPISFDQWSRLLERYESGQRDLGNIRPEPTLITDFYAYNSQTRPLPSYRGYGNRGFEHPADIGLHWVGDLAMVVDVDVLSDQGQIVLDLVEAGRHHECRIDLETGVATVSMADGKATFDGGNREAKSQTRVKGKGSYRIRFSNVDDELRLWVDDRLCEFDAATTFPVNPDDRPVTSDEDPGDLAPVGFAVKDAEVKVNDFQILRDIYYIATRMSFGSTTDYQTDRHRDIIEELKDPKEWLRSDNLFDRRNEVIFKMEADQFFPLGDNSPYSRDGRLWENKHYVDRDLLIGKAILIYWPHAWRVSLPFLETVPILPNFQRMGLIH